MRHLYTIGHSTHNIDDFISLLQKYHIDTIVDIRSIPYSKFASSYNKEALKNYLKKFQIQYIFMGELLGAKYDDKSFLFDEDDVNNGKVDFQKVQNSDKFRDGIRRLNSGIDKGYNISLMCSEKEPFDCHRFVLVSRVLSLDNIEVSHIYPDKVRSQKELEERLLEKYDKKLPQIDLFNPELTQNSKLQIAYRLRNIDIAYNTHR